jgi:hypothetical protein
MHATTTTITTTTTTTTTTKEPGRSSHSKGVWLGLGLQEDQTLGNEKRIVNE